MAKFTHCMFLLISFLALFCIVPSESTPKRVVPFIKGSPAPPASVRVRTGNIFITSSCSVTRYPALCVQSLSTFANTIQKSPRLMAKTALEISLSRARSAKTVVIQASRSKGIKKKDYQAVKDCIVNIGSCVDQLSKSIAELGKMGKGDEFFWHMSNVQTWTSAALTNVNTCLDGFSGRAMDGKIKNAITGRVSNIAQITSNALALVNRYSDRHYLYFMKRV